MRSPLVVPVGTELPQIVFEPPGVASRATARDTIELAARYQICDGEPLSPSQELRLLNGMAERADGSWAAKRVGDFGGRQGAGKSATVIARILGGIFLVGETLTIYTAHEYPTSNEIYIRVGQIFEAWDDLSRLVLHDRKAHGDQGFELKGPPGREITGKRRLLFKTRTGKSGRGFAKADLLIYDEAQHLQREHIAGSGPAKLANPNSQSWWSGSGGLTTSEPAWEMRRQAVTGVGSGRLSYTEHTAEMWTVAPGGRIDWVQPDPEDRDGWYRANCGLGRWVTEEDMADLKIELGSLFARECLCIWEPEPNASGSVIAFDDWNGLADPGSKVASHRQWSLSVSVDRKWTSFGTAGRRADGLLHVDTMKRAAGTGWVLDFAADVYAGSSIPIRVHKSGPEGSFIEPLRERGVEVVEVSSAEAAAATGQLIDAANAGTLRHLGQASLDISLRGAVLRTQSEGATLWSERSSQVEISSLRAVTVAAGGVPAAGPSVYVERGMRVIG